MARLFILFLISLTLFACASNPPAEKKTVEDVIPITMANMRGHQALYEEGWFVVTSSEKALAYAKEKSVISSREAVSATISSIASRNKTFAAELSDDVKDSIDLGVNTFKTGTRLTRETFATTSKLAGLQVDYAGKTFQKGWHRFIRGNLYMAARTQETREALMAQPGDYFKDLRSDFSNIYDVTASMQINFAERIGNTWSGAFDEAAQSFNEEYEASGQSSNSLGGLVHIFKGYGKGLYRGLFKPAVHTTGDTVSAGARGVAQVVFLPTATAVSVVGRTVQTIGTTVYYTGKLGVEIISPTVEGGLLSGLSILSLGTVPLTYVTGATVGAINQVAFTTAAPVVGAGNAAVNSAIDTGKYVAFVSYDAVVGTSKVVINQASSAVVLGYNALTAIPSHLIMGAVDSAVFLAWDGPRLVIAKARGEIGDDDKANVNQLPVGSVVDLKTLEQEGLEVEIVSDDVSVIKDVLKELPNDLRE